MLQYQTFCDGIEVLLNKVVSSLSRISLITTLRFSGIGKSGSELLHLLSAEVEVAEILEGEALLRVDNRYGLEIEGVYEFY